ncbi:MAG TPA: TonB-dependent receptor [Gemmatimonadaceae bacterium]|nr:TonB-dependent receptor [Gemmatimonadaceae bacterium]
MSPLTHHTGALAALVIAAAAVTPVVPVLAQTSTASVSGRVVDTAGMPLPTAIVHLRGTRSSAMTDGAGHYSLRGVVPGSYVMLVQHIGFAADSQPVIVRAGDVSVPDARMQLLSTILAGVVVEASGRMNETREAALARRSQADNFVVVQSGDEIRSLPNANAAEALARMPGVSTERDEGEGKFVQIRGTEPRLSNVTIDGAHVPGTESQTRIPKLDAVPTDLLGAVEVSETLTADMDADAIGGSVNLVTKTPQGAPRGYFALQGGQQSQLNRTQAQWSLMYGGRTQENGKLGFLLGANYDRNNRSIEDVEPAWTADGSRVFPTEWDQRDYLYYRTRTGLGGDLDYRFDGGSTVALKGLFSEFHNYGTRYRFDAALGDDSTGSGATGVGSGATFVRQTERRTPNERMYGFTLNGQSPTSPLSLDWGANVAGTRQWNTNSRDNTFEYDGPTGDGVPLKYDGSDQKTPRYRFVSAADSMASLNPSNYALTQVSIGAGLAKGADIGAHLDGVMHYSLGTNPSALKLGLKFRDETKSYVNNGQVFVPKSAITLNQVQADYSDPSFYSTVAPGFLMGPQANEGSMEAYFAAHPEQFTNTTNVVKNQLGGYNGSEAIYSAYAMHTSDAGNLHVNLGLRSEVTHSDYTGHVASKVGAATSVTTVPGAQTYVDLFPSAQLKYSLDDRSDIRVAVTRGIARPNYFDLAPHLTGTECPTCKFQFGNLSAGNPDLQPQHAWNYDLGIERYLTRGGLMSATVFYKNISDFIYSREFVYDGPLTEFEGYFGTRPENGGSARLDGVELTYVQRFYTLPGALSGLGVDMNWTHTDSRADLLADTATTATGLGSPVARHAPLARQAPNVANAAGTYDLGNVSARLAYQYQGASIYEYGDGSATPDGDVYLYQHGQVDASVLINLTQRAQLQIQGLDLNNAIFGFYVGDPSHAYSIQREVYGRSFIVGMKLGF